MNVLWSACLLASLRPTFPTMGDYTLSPAEVAAISLGTDAFFLAGPRTGEHGGGGQPPELGRHPRRVLPPPPAPDHQLAALLELLPEELLALRNPPPLRPDAIGIPDDDDDDEEQPVRPAPRAAAESLERVVVEEAEPCDRCCPICLEEMEVGGEARAIGCSHWFHDACIFEWLRRSSSCPLCRFQITVG